MFIRVLISVGFWFLTADMGTRVLVASHGVLFLSQLLINNIPEAPFHAVVKKKKKE